MKGGEEHISETCKSASGDGYRQEHGVASCKDSSRSILCGKLFGRLGVPARGWRARR